MKIFFIFFMVYLGAIFSRENPKTYILISNPRSLTSAFERSIMERGDFDVIHEPWAVVYWVHKKGIDIHNSEYRQELAKNASHEEVKKYIKIKKKSKPIFIKDFAITLYDDLIEDEEFLSDPNNIFFFLIRNPYDIFISLYNMHKSNVDMGSLNSIDELVDYKKLKRLYEKLVLLRKQPPLVLQAEDLQKNPSQIMQRFCNEMDIEFIPEALQWNPGLPEEWEAGERWHLTAINSSGFIASCPKTIEKNGFISEQDLSYLEQFTKKNIEGYEYLKLHVFD